MGKMGKVIKVSDEVFERLEAYEKKHPNKTYWGYEKSSKNMTIEKILTIAEEQDKNTRTKVTKRSSKK